MSYYSDDLRSESPDAHVTPLPRNMSIKQACDVAGKYNQAVFARHNFEESWDARSAILWSFSSKYQRLDDVIKAQDLIIDRAEAAVVALERASHKISNSLPDSHALLPLDAQMMLRDIYAKVGTVNTREVWEQRLLAQNAEKTRVVANAAKMMLADYEVKYHLPFFVTPTAQAGCGVELGDYTGKKAIKRTARTCTARLIMGQMDKDDTIWHWYDADKATVDDVMGYTLGQTWSVLF